MKKEAKMGKIGVVITFFFMIITATRMCHGQSGTSAEAYINEVESEVKRIAQQAVQNFMNSCDLLASCGGNCSRQACVPLKDDVAGYACKHVANNTNCYAENGKFGCQDLRVSLARSFVRLPTGSNVTLTNEADAAICAQRMLDPTFMNISSSHNSALNLTSWTYFASVEGVQRAFPGRDVAENNCTFEPRTRPWYLGVVAVTKDVILLLDAGISMGESLPGDLLVSGGTTKLQATVSISFEFLGTLAFGDRVTVVTYASIAATPVLPSITFNGTNLQSLKAALQELVASSIQGASNLTAAFLLANQSFGTSNDLKVLLMFTDGQVTSVNIDNSNGTETVFDNIRSQNALVQIYSFDRTFADSATLSQVACDCGGTYVRISESVSDPLWTLRSYYGILARIRLTAVNNTPSWTAPYQDDGSLGTVITVVYPAFADNYTLVGVAGIDVLLEELGSIAQDAFSSALSTHGDTNSLPNLTSPILSCSFNLSVANQCTNVTAPAYPLCQSTDTSGMSFEERVCECPGVCLASAVGRGKNSLLTPAQISGIGVGVAASLLLLAVLLFICLRRKKRKAGQPRKTETPVIGFPSDPLLKFQPGSHLSSPSLKSPRGRSHANSGKWGSQAGKDLIEYTPEQLHIATDGWSEAAELGRGAHGLVYKGIFADGTLAAIKKPTRDVNQNAWDTFATELELLSKLNHKRLVRLLGYCKDEIILVYEFMENGTLGDWLHSPDHAMHKLGWESRLKIAMGAAKGLEYLHEYAVPRIYHGDVKPANILLDQNWEAHVSDFGLSLWSRNGKDSYLMASRMGGTFGYLDPEFVSSGQATFASDVYSFGIVLLELISGRPVVVDYENIKDWAAKLAEEDRMESILDPSLDEPTNIDAFIEIIPVALKCAERKKQDRPKMKDVASALDHAWRCWVRSQQRYS